MKVTQGHFLMHWMNGHTDGLSCWPLRQESLGTGFSLWSPRKPVGTVPEKSFIFTTSSKLLQQLRKGEVFLERPTAWYAGWVVENQPGEQSEETHYSLRGPGIVEWWGPREGGDPSLFYLPEKGSSYCSGYFLKVGWKRWRVQFTQKNFPMG